MQSKADESGVSWIAEKPEHWDGKRAVILAHGAGQGIDSPFMTFFRTELPRHGLLCVMFNFEYMERKKGPPDPMPKMQARYRRVIESVREAFHPQCLAIGGKSMGGRVASHVAADTAGLCGLVFLGYPLHPPGKPDQLRDAHLYELSTPMLFLSGTRDTFARRDLLEQVTGRLGANARLVWTERGDHSLRVGRQGVEPLHAAALTIAEWMQDCGH